MICARTSRRRGIDVGVKAAATAGVMADPAGSQANFFYGTPAPYAESIAPSHHSTYAHYYDEEEDGWEMPNFYNETYMKGRWVPQPFPDAPKAPEYTSKLLSAFHDGIKQ